MTAGKRNRNCGEQDRNNHGVYHSVSFLLLLMGLFLQLEMTDAFVPLGKTQTQRTTHCKTSTEIMGSSFDMDIDMGATEGERELLSIIKTTTSASCSAQESNSNTLSRRSAMLAAAKSASAAFLALSIAPSNSLAASASATPTITEIQASWKAVDGLNTMEGDEKKNFVGFDKSAYQAMINDQSRTPMFYKVMADRINDGKGATTVLDLGTGPFAIFAIKAAELGATKVYAIEANPEAPSWPGKPLKRRGSRTSSPCWKAFPPTSRCPTTTRSI